MLDNILRNAETKVVVNFVGITLFRIILFFFLEYTHYLEYQHESIAKKEYEIGGSKFFVEHPYKLELFKKYVLWDSMLFSESHHFRYHW
jgi:hypothetical protein